ncbi:hypothetical protein M9H77_35912 [Catharanthus roseus]|uniref:Uncharacterized protein n=1 Tax=Catharanthus roseus TaxID=4058 RepID=A0ACB9ZUL3_CATRO|nr:hypothetical protein M9H77_35912 [Catharanthus roseus]
MEEQLIQIEQFRKSHVPPRNILRFFREQNVGCAVRYVELTLMYPGFIFRGRNTVEEVLCLSDKREYTVFYRNYEDSNMLSDIVVAHPRSIEMLRTWPYNQEDVYETIPKVIITDRECSLMPMIGEVFSTTYHMLCRRHINQNVLAKLTELTKDEEVPSRFVNGS